jgi:hypothetical protein
MNTKGAELQGCPVVIYPTMHVHLASLLAFRSASLDNNDVESAPRVDSEPGAKSTLAGPAMPLQHGGTIMTRIAKPETTDRLAIGTEPSPFSGPRAYDLGAIVTLTGSGNDNLRDNPGSIIPRYTDIKTGTEIRLPDDE